MNSITRQVNASDLAQIATGRQGSLFEADVAGSDEQLVAALAGRRVLVIGGAGTIGFATLDLISRYRPEAIHVVDQNENGLAEVVRHFRSRPEGLGETKLRIFPIDCGSPAFRRVLQEAGPYDAVLNFSALKHVRSERDIPSLMQMFDTNLLKNRYVMQELARRGFEGRYFCVSTDKAANPVSLMGASKRLMEHLIFSGAIVPEFGGTVTSARFANVAFSAGSLLDGFIRRLEKAQPIAVPSQTQRYFVSARESGEICTLAAFCAPPNTIVAPDFEDALQLIWLEDVAKRFVQAHGLEPRLYEDEALALTSVASDLEQGRYPVLLTALDTSGEKPYEEFVGAGEQVVDIGLNALQGVTYLAADPGQLAELFGKIDRLVGGEHDLDKGELVKSIQLVVPQFAHRETGVSLDDRV